MASDSFGTRAILWIHPSQKCRVLVLLHSTQSQPNPEQTNTTQSRARAPVKLRVRGGRLPGEDHDKIHHVPAVPQVRAFVENKAQSDDFDTSFKTKYSNKVRLSVVLEKKEN